MGQHLKTVAQVIRTLEQSDAGVFLRKTTDVRLLKTVKRFLPKTDSRTRREVRQVIACNPHAPLSLIDWLIEAEEDAHTGGGWVVDALLEMNPNPTLLEHYYLKNLPRSAWVWAINKAMPISVLTHMWEHVEHEGRRAYIERRLEEKGGLFALLED